MADDDEINRRVDAVRYLTRENNAEYIGIVDVLANASVELSPAKVSEALALRGLIMDSETARVRLGKLHEYGVVSPTTDFDTFSSFKDFQTNRQEFAINALGRAVHGFYLTVLAGDHRPAEVNLTTLEQMITALEDLARDPAMSDRTIDGLVTTLFTNHEVVDTSFLGVGDTLSKLMSRFDLDDDGAAELRGMLEAYAIRLQFDLITATDRADKALAVLRPRFGELAARFGATSTSSDLVAAGHLAGRRGSEVEHWERLDQWLDPRTGRAARFEREMLRAVPTLMSNVRRLLDTGRGTTRERALALAVACLDPTHSAAVFTAATGDHAWTKYVHTATEEPESAPFPSWEKGPRIPLPRFTRTGATAGGRGRTAPPRDDTEARRQARAELERELRLKRASAITAVRVGIGEQMPDEAARLVLHALNAGVARPDGVLAGMDYDALLIVTQRPDPGAHAVLVAPTWKYLIEDTAVSIAAGPELAFVQPSAEKVA